MEMAPLGQGTDCCLHLLTQLFGRRLVEDVEEIVVVDLEHLRGQAHAERIALTQIEVDHYSHRFSLHSSLMPEAAASPGVFRPLIGPRKGRSGCS